MAFGWNHAEALAWTSYLSPAIGSACERTHRRAGHRHERADVQQLPGLSQPPFAEPFLAFEIMGGGGGLEKPAVMSASFFCLVSAGFRYSDLVLSSGAFFSASFMSSLSFLFGESLRRP